MSDELLRVEEGSLYPALHRMKQEGWLRSEWKTLSPEALDAFCDHIRNNDFAETAAKFHAMATNAGFSRWREINRFR